MARTTITKVDLKKVAEFQKTSTEDTFIEIFGAHLGRHHWKKFTDNNYQLPFHLLDTYAMEKLSEYIAKMKD